MAYSVTVDLEPPAEGAVDPDAVRALVEQALATDAVEDGATLAVVMAGDTLLRELNQRHRGIDAPTDVLSFEPSEDDGFPREPDAPRHLGDIAVSVETVRRQSSDLGIPFMLELRHVVLHGVLHLIGYDHETTEDELRMRAREETVLGPEVHASGAAHSE